MKKIMKLYPLVVLLFASAFAIGQSSIKGHVIDAITQDPLIGANVVVEGTTDGNITDWDGYFELTTDASFPLILTVSYLGYVDQNVSVSDPSERVAVSLEEESITINVVEVKASRIADEVKKSPLTIESMDLLAVKETPSSNFYEGLGALKGVDLTTASLGFQIVNTRGFNSTSPVRSLQIIDGIDNQAPGLNFSLGNFLGSSELDVLKVDLIVGASSAFYGPSAFNGVVSMSTKDPFLQKGLSAYVKGGERSMLETAFRWADDLTNKDGVPWMAYKFNFSFLRANDWEADNEDPVFGTITGPDNPGRYNKVNTYGDEYQANFDLRSAVPWEFIGLKVYHRTGYAEKDLVDYDTRNLKSNAAFHIRLNPAQGISSPELILSSSFSSGTTVYQGDNRFSLKNILFFQNRLELIKKDKYFIRAYMTQDNAGDSYDPYFTALIMQGKSKSTTQWSKDYVNYWRRNIEKQIKESGYPKLMVGIDSTGMVFTSFDQAAADAWFADPVNQQNLFAWHSETEAAANLGVPGDNTADFYEPGTMRFQELFDQITSRPSGDVAGGTKFIDRSALYHVHGEYQFEPHYLDFIKVGANMRLYTPESEGTVFVDSLESVDINNFEYGIYGGFQRSVVPNKLKISATLRMDKNENFDYLFSPAASIVWTPAENNFFRLSLASAIRNPTLTDQYLDLNVGRAILRGNLNGVEDLITVESFDVYRNNNLRLDSLKFFDIAPIQPEKVKSIEVGYRTTLFESLFADASYYYSIYNDFIGYNIGIDASFDQATGFPLGVQAYRYSANSTNRVETQGFSIGLNYYFGNFRLAGNYSWNKLVKTDEDDPIIPAFNTPEHKYNIGFSGRNLSLNGSRNGNFGFNCNYKWIQGFIFEGSPQFTGFIPSYGLVDVQLNYDFPTINTNVKIGASNVLDNKVYQTYGGPLVGRLAYVKLTYEFKID
jgi:outer membrane receptor protein involved in Fe transport